jgi:hypothetical protein
MPFPPLPAPDREIPELDHRTVPPTAASPARNFRRETADTGVDVDVGGGVGDEPAGDDCEDCSEYGSDGRDCGDDSAITLS